jgi:hypothetical protein
VFQDTELCNRNYVCGKVKCLLSAINPNLLLLCLNNFDSLILLKFINQEFVMKNKILYITFFLLLTSALFYAQESDSIKIGKLEERIKKLEEKIEQDELDKLLNEAETIANRKEEKKESKEFTSGQRSLQAINPEISVLGDMFGQYIANENGFNEELRSGAFFRVMETSFQSNLDPFSLAKFIVELNPEGIEFAEGYMTWTEIFAKVGLTAGKFRQQFGVINRWHVHSLDQFDYPLALNTILGEDGLNQIGLSFDWAMPSIISDANFLTLQITNGQNEQLFSGDMFSFPSGLLHLKNYWDLSRNTYLELGLTGMIGKNNQRGYDEDGNLILEDSRLTALGGLDLTVFWEPLNQARYHSFIWRTELYYANKEQLNDRIKVLGGYSYIDYKFDLQWHIGARFDYTQPFETNNSEKYSYQIIPYITWWQSNWVRLRLQYNYLNSSESPTAQNTIRLQIVFAAGPHKHDRY